MKLDDARAPGFRRAILAIAFCLTTSHGLAAVTFQESDDALTCKMGDQILWRFSYNTNVGKPFFHPLSVLAGEPLTAFRPKDHPWHYGLWFSWKYINGVNYWEE